MIEQFLKLLGIRREHSRDDPRRPPSSLREAIRPNTSRPPPQTAGGKSPPPAANRQVREDADNDTDKLETLSIVDDSMSGSGEETGFDPYNTGQFDRTKNWERHF